jgi:hypothetical protein
MHLAILVPMAGRIAVGLYTLSLLGKSARWVRYTIWFLIVQQLVHNIAISATLLAVCGVDMRMIGKYVPTCDKSEWTEMLTFNSQSNFDLLQAVTMVALRTIRWW